MCSGGMCVGMPRPDSGMMGVDSGPPPSGCTPECGITAPDCCGGTCVDTSGVPAGLVGVMVAVALMPPLIVAGLFTGQGEMAEAGQALLLVTTNVVCVNLTAVSTFVLQGIRPKRWWEAERAKKATHIALYLWGSALALLIVLLLLSGRI